MRLDRAYLLVLGCAALCYAALGAVLRLLPSYVPGPLGGGDLVLGLAVGAPAAAAVLTRPAGGRLGDARGPRRVVVAGGLVMAVATVPAVLVEQTGALLASRFAVGAGEGVMMSASVLWLLRLAGPGRRGRALGHIGLANYAGLAVGPLLADAAGGSGHPLRVLALSAVLPAVASGLVLLLPPAPSATQAAEGEAGERQPWRALARLILRPGLGLLCVNVGYAALLAFGPLAAARGAGGVVVPAFAAGVIAARVLGASIPDRAGAVPTLAVSALVAAAGLAAVAVAPGTAGVLAATVVLALGQALAVPALGLLALRDVPAAAHGAAAGTFFAFFDLGVGLGGPLSGAAAHVVDADGALFVAAAVVALSPLVAGGLRRPQRSRATRTLPT